MHNLKDARGESGRVLTKIGLLPPDWEAICLGEITDPEAPIRYGVVQIGPDTPGGVPIVPIKHIGRVSSASLHRASPTIERKYAGSRIRGGDILLSVKGTIGHVGVVPEDFNGNIAREIARIRLRQGYDANFVALQLEADHTQRRISSETVGSTRLEFSIHAVRNFSIAVPTCLAEQRRIAEILGTWDEAIEKLESLRAANLRRRTWFRTNFLTGKVRLPTFSCAWSEAPLSAVLIEHGLTGTGAEPVFSVSVHKGLINQIEHLGRSYAAAETGHYNRVLPGDIVYTKSPTGDFPLGIIKQSRVSHDVIVSPLYGVFTPITKDMGSIIEAYFESPITIRNYLHPLVQKGAKNTISITNPRFLEGKLNLPTDVTEQAAIADVIRTSHAELAAIETSLGVLNLQKRGLMQKLLTGQWRVSRDREKEAAA